MRLAIIELGNGATLQALSEAIRAAGIGGQPSDTSLPLGDQIKQALNTQDIDGVALQPLAIRGIGEGRAEVDRVLARWPVPLISRDDQSLVATNELAEILEVLGPLLVQPVNDWRLLHTGTDSGMTVHVQIAETNSGKLDHLLILETNIDDMSPQFYELLVERLFAAGARDVWTTPIIMKKQRPATMLSTLVRPSDQDLIVAILIEQSTTLGVRITSIERIAAERRIESVVTRVGEVRIKLKIWQGRVLDAVPEYDDCAALARAHDLPIRGIWVEAATMAQVFIGRQVEGRALHLRTLDQGGIPHSSD